MTELTADQQIAKEYEDYLRWTSYALSYIRPLLVDDPDEFARKLPDCVSNLSNLEEGRLTTLYSDLREQLLKIMDESHKVVRNFIAEINVCMPKSTQMTKSERIAHLKDLITALTQDSD